MLILLPIALLVLVAASTASRRAAPSSARLTWIVPVVGRVSSPYGVRRGRMHQGADVQAPAGAPVVAVAPGVIVAVSPDGERANYGNTVIVRHDDGTATVYAHLKAFAPYLRTGQRVAPGERLGTIGTTQAPLPAGEVAHLHFEVLRELVTDARGRPILNRDTPTRIDPQQWRGPRVA